MEDNLQLNYEIEMAEDNSEIYSVKLNGELINPVPPEQVKLHQFIEYDFQCARTGIVVEIKKYPDFTLFYVGSTTSLKIEEVAQFQVSKILD